MKLNKTSIPPGGSVTLSPEETDTQKRLVSASTVTCLSCSEHNKQTTRLKKHDTHKLSHFCTKIVFVFLYRKRDITARQRTNQCTTAWSKATEASSHINKSVFSLLHRLSTWRYLHLLLSAGACSTVPTDVNRYVLQTPALNSKPAGSRCCCRSMGQTYGRTDERMPNLYVDPVQHTLRERR